MAVGTRQLASDCKGKMKLTYIRLAHTVKYDNMLLK